MPTVIARSQLSRSDIRLFLSNQDGYAQDGYNVRWTVLNSNGIPVSGSKLPAIKRTTGEYYAPWFADVAQGNYEVEWSFQEDLTSPPRVIKEKIYVIDPGSQPRFAPPKTPPLSGGFAYWMGTQLGRGDLPLFLRDENGFAFNAFAVFWTFYNQSGCAVSDRTPATIADTGEYYANTIVNLIPGSYRIVWEFMQTQDSPMESTSMDFSILTPMAIPGFGFCIQTPEFGCPPCTSHWTSGPSIHSGCCDIIPSKLVCGLIQALNSSSFTIQSVPVITSVPGQPSCNCVEIPRTIHLVEGPLPSGGAFTNQTPFPVPLGIQKISFYIKYQNGTQGGYATLKLLWGNGSEEVPETVVTGLSVSQPTGSQSLLIQTLDSPVPIDSAPISFTISATTPGGATTVRLVAAEKGFPSIPGTVSISLTASS